MPRYIIDELTYNKRIDICLHWIIVLFVVRFLFGNFNAFIEVVINCKSEKLIQMHYKNFSDKTMSIDLCDIEDTEINDKKEKAQNVITWNSKNIDGIKNSFGGIFIYNSDDWIFIFAHLNVFIIVPIILVIFFNSRIGKHFLKLLENYSILLGLLGIINMLKK